MCFFLIYLFLTLSLSSLSLFPIHPGPRLQLLYVGNNVKLLSLTPLHSHIYTYSHGPGLNRYLPQFLRLLFISVNYNFIS